MYSFRAVLSSVYGIDFAVIINLTFCKFINLP